MNDPLTGQPSNGSILLPNSLRTRSSYAVAEPNFIDALTTIIAHKQKMNYWVTHYDLAVEMNAILANREVMNSVKAQGGVAAANELTQRINYIAQGGIRDASATVELSKSIKGLSNRAATIGLLGRFSTLLVQSTQLAAASVKMPVLAYAKRFALMTTGNLGFGAALSSPFIQRRLNSQPPIVKQALERLSSAKRPNEISQAVRLLGQTLSGADALFTAGTYTILMDYHMTVTGPKAGLTGSALARYANDRTEREVEQVAQPMRAGNRSTMELTTTSPMGKIGWAYISEARQKIALFAWAAANAKKDPIYLMKVANLTFVVGGLLTQVLKNGWRELLGDDDEKKWDWDRLLLGMLSRPVQGIPVVGSLMGEGDMLSGFHRSGAAVKRISHLAALEWDYEDANEVMRDVDTILSAAGLFNEDVAGLSTLSHIAKDAVSLFSNAIGD